LLLLVFTHDCDYSSYFESSEMERFVCLDVLEDDCLRNRNYEKRESPMKLRSILLFSSLGSDFRSGFSLLRSFRSGSFVPILRVFSD